MMRYFNDDLLLQLYTVNKKRIRKTQSTPIKIKIKKQLRASRNSPLI